jgi:hypothetical protein
MDDISLSDSILDSLISVPATVETDDSSETFLEECGFGDNTFCEGGNNRISRAILTFFPPNSTENWLSPEHFFHHTTKRINVWVAQYENCPDTGRLHCHVYVEFKNSFRPSFNTIKKIFENHNLQVSIRLSKRSSNKQRQCAVNYVSDPDKRACDCLPFEAFFWPNNNPVVAFDPHCVSKKRKSDSTEEQRLYIETKPIFWSWDQLVHENNHSKQLLATCSWGKSYHAGRYAEIPRRVIADVIIMYGAGGTGKTTLSLSHNEDKDPQKDTRYYRRNPDDGHFWGGGRTAYKGQSVVHFEEFIGQELFSRLKEICDIGKQGPSVNIKNGGTDLNHDTVIFTSNVHPAGWYRKLWTDDPKQFHPFWRRITKVLFFPPFRSDGSLNIPDASTSPYFIDQTDDWIAFQGDYDSAITHASVHWPLKEVEETDVVHDIGRGIGVRIRNGNNPKLFC